MSWLCSDDRRSNASVESGALRGPLPKGEKDLHFPVYNPVEKLTGHIWTYCSVQMASGNGFPPRQIEGAFNQTEKHFRQGVSIGDVGILDADGGFTFYFNIFYPADDPIQTSDIPRKFKPIEPPLRDWEVRTTDKYFQPGSIVASEGVHVSRVSESPLKIEFSSSALEGAALVLPSGASRDDLVDVTKLYPYLTEHATDWYHCFNGYGGADDDLPSPAIMNGTILVVTGSDRALNYANASFPLSNQYPPGFQHNFTFDETHQNWWSHSGSVEVAATKEPVNNDNLVAVFYRGVTVALSSPIWLQHLPLIPFNEVPCYSVPSTPMTSLRARLENFIAAQRGTTMEALKHRMRIPFHPSTVLVQMLLQADPSAEYAVVDDSVWCNLINGVGKNPTHQQLPLLLRDILDKFDIVTTQGIVTFLRKGTENPASETPAPRTSTVSYLMSIWSKSPKTRALQAIPNILSVPGKEYR